MRTAEDSSNFLLIHAILHHTKDFSLSGCDFSHCVIYKDRGDTFILHLRAGTHQRISNGTLNEMTAGKNKNARRSVKLSSMAMQTLAAQRNMLDAMGINSEWVFPDEWGELSDPNRAYKQWQFFCRTHSVSSTIHEMRHTYISMMKNDMPEQMLKDLVGHSVNMNTYATYGHVVNPEMDRAKQIMDATFDRFLGRVDFDLPAELPPQVGKVARGHVDTRHTDAIKAKERRPRLPDKTTKRGRPCKKVNT